jgi:DNA-binding XRE family transcriptional regulator
MHAPDYVTLDGREYVVLARREYERLTALARVAEMPPVPKSDKAGNVPAAAYARASIAREIVHRRARAGLTQRELAGRAGVRVETLCRIEKGKHTASTATIAKLDRALAQAEHKAMRARRRA